MAKIRAVVIHGRKKQEIDLGRVAGKRRRRFVDTKTTANAVLKTYKKKRELLGNQWDELEARKKWSILEILDEIKDHGMNLAEVWESYQKTHLSHGKSTLEDAIADFMELKKEAGRRSRYTEEMTRTLARFAQGREKRQIGSVGTGELRSWITSFDGSAATRHTMQTRLKVFFSWAERQGLIAENPTKRLESIRIDQADPQILNVEQCKQLIDSASEIDPDMLTYFALALFCGIRPDECMRLTGNSVDLERGQVVVSGDASKTRNRRIVAMLPPAVKIFEKHKGLKFSINFRRRRAAIKKHANIKKWPSDVLRHTAASHFYNIYGMDEATKQLGHSGAIMLKHYRQMISKNETEEWLML
jgi:integrase